MADITRKIASSSVPSDYFPSLGWRLGLMPVPQNDFDFRTTTVLKQSQQVFLLV